MSGMYKGMDGLEGDRVGGGEGWAARGRLNPLLGLFWTTCSYEFKKCQPNKLRGPKCKMSH